MRISRYFAPASVLTLLLCGSVALAHRHRAGQWKFHAHDSGCEFPIQFGSEPKFSRRHACSCLKHHRKCRRFANRRPVYERNPSYARNTLGHGDQSKWHASIDIECLLFARNPCATLRSIESEHHIFSPERPDRDCCGEFTGEWIARLRRRVTKYQHGHCGMERF